jgi:hypothetical protein
VVLPSGAGAGSLTVVPPVDVLSVEVVPVSVVEVDPESVEVVPVSVDVVSEVG